ncbi:MAG: putative quinol monooxygenase [Betaproteobacteria bacterium]
MGRFVITVDFALHVGTLEKFLPLIVENANQSRTAEPGCDRFDVVVAKDSRDRVFLYEIYKDKAAFGEHIKSSHFRQFDAASKTYVQEKKVTEYSLENDDGR